MALALLSLSILTMVGLVPVVMGTHQVSREMVEGRGLMEEVLVDLRNISLGERQTRVYGMMYDPLSVRKGDVIGSGFSQEGEYLGSGGKGLNGGGREFYFVEYKVEEVEREFNRIQVRGRLRVSWPEPGDFGQKKVRKEFPLPVVVSYEK